MMFGKAGGSNGASPGAAAAGAAAAPAGGSAPQQPSSPASSAASHMLSFARALGMGKGSGGAAANPPAAAPLDLPNPSTASTADTSSVFYVDDTLSELARVKRYSLSQLPLQRLVYVKRIASCARAVGLRDALGQLLPLFSKLAVDQEAVVRSAAAAELANIAHFLADPNVPYQTSSTASAVASALAPSKPPSTAQSPDLTLEDDQLVDFDVSDVNNVLPPHMPAAASAAAAAEAATDPLGVLHHAQKAAGVPAGATPVNPDAMDVDAVATVAGNSPSADGADGKDAEAQAALRAQAAADGDESEPMDVSEGGVVEETTSSNSQEEQANGVTAAEAAADTAAATSTAATDSPAAASTVTPSSPPSPPLSPSTGEATAAAAAAAAAAADSSSSAVGPVPPTLSPSKAASSVAPAASPSSSSASASSSSDPSFDPTSSLRLESYEQIKDTVIPALQSLILDNNAEVRAAACDALVRVADVLRGDDVGKVVLTLVLNLAHDERDEQRTTAVHLMHELAPRLGHDLCRSFVALELAAFADDSTFRVRKATAQSFGNVCAMVGEQFTVSKLLPCYVRLSKDLIWGVRASCAKSLIAVTQNVGEQVRAEVCVPMFDRFAKDSSRWVRNGAFEILGPFIHALGPNLASRPLVAMFAGIPNMSTAIVDADVNYYAAFNLPAVLQTIGPARWDELAQCFNQLVKDSKYPVRRTLSYSLHELAALLGPQLTESSLLPALDTFLRDLDEVRYGVLKTFAQLMRSISPTRRIAYLEVMWMVQKQNEQWRWRMLWAKQIGAFAKLFDAEHTVTDILPLAFALCRDNVAAVRRTAATALPRVLARILTFAQPNNVLSQCIADMHALATSATYMDRQLYLRVVEGAVGQVPADLLEQFLQRTLTLCDDRTSNVRLACAHAMRAVLAHPHIQASATAREIVQRLSQDKHAEVRRCMTEAQTAQATTAVTASLASLDINTNKEASGAGVGASASAAAAPASTTSNDQLTDADLNDILDGPTVSSDSTAAATSASADGAAAAAAAAPGASKDASESSTSSASSADEPSLASTTHASQSATSDDGDDAAARDDSSSQQHEDADEDEAAAPEQVQTQVE